jgi:hypothetical protein
MSKYLPSLPGHVWCFRLKRADKQRSTSCMYHQGLRVQQLGPLLLLFLQVASASRVCHDVETGTGRFVGDQEWCTGERAMRWRAVQQAFERLMQGLLSRWSRLQYRHSAKSVLEQRLAREQTFILVKKLETAVMHCSVLRCIALVLQQMP